MAKLLKKASDKIGHRHKLSRSNSQEYISAGVQRDEEDYFDAAETLLHIDAHDEGGLGFTNKQLLEAQRSAVMELAKDVGRMLLSGHLNLINISMPVKMFEPRSYLEKLTDVWVYPRFLRQAAACQDPLERMRLVVTWFAAGLQHVFQSWRKPFNPILGETWQARQSDGTQIFVEQISHHPPITSFQMLGAGGSYQFAGMSQPDVSYKANAIKTTAKGFRRVTFADGTRIDITYPSYYMRGILYTSMPRGDMGGTARFLDKGNRLCCEVTFGKLPDAADPLLQRADTIHGTIFRVKEGPSSMEHIKNGKSHSSLGGFASAFATAIGAKEAVSDGPAREQVAASCQGNWLSHLDWDGKRYWTLVEEQPDPWQAVPHPLPSDCRFRADLVALAAGDLALAQQKKEELENIQRAEAKLRKHEK